MGAPATNATWRGHVLTLSDIGGRGAALASDLDGTTLYIDFWGSGAASNADSVFDVVWESVRKLR